MALKETVLCFKRSLLKEEDWLQGLKTKLNGEKQLLREPKNLLYLPRAKAENDPSHKQLIPYVLVIKDDQILRYRRKGAESRLHGFWSIGIGGHIVETDRNQHSTDRTGYHEGMLREIREEIGNVPTTGLSPEPVAAINDDSTEVGRVHFGLVHILSVPDNCQADYFSEIQDPEFREINEIVEDNRRNPKSYETWTRLCLNKIGPLLSLAQ